MSDCNHKWSEETHEGVLSRCCHVCNEWEVELELHALEAELTSTKAALIDAALIHAKLIQERDEARRDLGEILAVIHRDGGHHTGEHGLSQSVADAHATWASVVRERDEARAEVERLRNADPGPRSSG